MNSWLGHFLQFCRADEAHQGGIHATRSVDVGAYLPLSSILPYQCYSESENVYYNQKSQGFILQIEPLVGATEEMVGLLTSMLADNLTPKMHAQFLLWASPDIEPHLEAFYQARAGDTPLLQRLAASRREYLADGNLKSLSRTGTVLLRDFQLYLVISQPNAAHATEQLLQAKAAITASLKSLSMAHQVMPPQSFIPLMQALLCPNIQTPEFVQWDQDNPLNLQITNPEIKVTVKANNLDFSDDTTHWQSTAFTVKQFPAEMNQWWMGESIGRLCDPNNALQIPGPFILSLHLKIQDADSSNRQAQWQWLQKDRNMRSPLSKFMPSLAQTHAEWDGVRHAVKEGARLVQAYFQAIVLSPKEQHVQSCSALKDLFRANGWQLKRERFLQLPAFLSAMPMMLSEGLWDDMKLMGRMRTMTTEQAIHIAPLQGEWKGMDSPRLLLPGRRGQMAFWDPFAHQESNYNVAIAASSGRGKSAFTQEYIVAQYTSGARVWVIDVGRSYEKTCELLKGQFIAFEPNSQISLNPFTNIKDINESLTLLKPLLGAMARPSGHIQDEESTYLEKAIKAAWDLKGNAADITTVADWLSQQDIVTCQTLSHLLYPYTTQGMYGAYFNGPCDFKQDNAFMVLELEELKSKKDLQKIILLVLMYHIAENMYMGNREQAKSCIIDEAWDLLSEENHAAAHFIETGFRRARRYNANFVTITQSINDYFKHATALAAFENAFWKVILGQEAESIEQLKQQGKFELDDYSDRLLKSLRKTDDYAECMIKAGGHVSVHRIIFDAFSRVLYSSKGEEFAAVKAYQKQGFSLVEAIGLVAKRYERKDE